MTETVKAVIWRSPRSSGGLLFEHTYFGTWLVNTMLLAALVVPITLFTAIPVGYALARLRLPGAGSIGIATFMTYMVPPTILFVPLARVVGALGLFDSGGRSPPERPRSASRTSRQVKSRIHLLPPRRLRVTPKG